MPESARAEGTFKLSGPFHREEDDPLITEAKKLSARASSRGERVLSRARELRRRLSPPEVILWSRLRPKVCKAVKFRRQHPVGPYIADFYCFSAGLVIELDGWGHRLQAVHDRTRDAYLRGAGYVVMRIEVSEFMKDVDGWVAAIVDRAKQLTEQRGG